MVRCAFGHLGELARDGCGSAPFAPPPVAPADSPLAREFAQLQQEGYVRFGPLRVPECWLRDAESYRRGVRLVADHVLAQPNDGEPMYVPKAAAELEPMLALWPFVLVLPTTACLSLDELILARAWPIHVLGVMTGPSLADGRLASPAEFFYHDVDHARFKVREDLLARGVVIPDAYVDGSTLDRVCGEHRRILPTALAHVDATSWHGAEARSLLARELLDAIANERDRDVAEAARWLLFECVHEKSLPLDVAVLMRALATDAHCDKLRRKCVRGFFGPVCPGSKVVARLHDARLWLRTHLEVSP